MIPIIIPAETNGCFLIAIRYKTIAAIISNNKIRYVKLSNLIEINNPKHETQTDTKIPRSVFAIFRRIALSISKTL